MATFTDLTPKNWTGPVVYVATGGWDYESSQLLGAFTDKTEALTTADNAASSYDWTAVDTLPLGVAL